MAMKQFSTAARRGAAAVNNPADITFEFEITEGEFVEMTSHAPTTGQIALFLADQGEGGNAAIRAMFELLECILDPEDWKRIETQLRTGMDVQVVVELIQYLIEEWGARPTSPPSDSSTLPSTTGKRSTVKLQPVASNTST